MLVGISMVEVSRLMINILDDSEINNLMVMINIFRQSEEWDYLNDVQKKQWIKEFIIKNFGYE